MGQKALKALAQESGFGNARLYMFIVQVSFKTYLIFTIFIKTLLYKRMFNTGHTLDSKTTMDFLESPAEAGFYFGLSISN